MSTYIAICNECAVPPGEFAQSPRGTAAATIIWLLTHAVEQHPDSPVIEEGPPARAATDVPEPNPWASPPGVRPDDYEEPF